MTAAPQKFRVAQHATPDSPAQLSVFARMANAVAHASGRPATFAFCCLIIIVWAVTGPIFHYSDTWQLIINTGTTIITFLMVFLIQNTQNRDMLTVQLKLSELVLAMKEAEDRFASIEDMSDEELEELHEQCKRRAEHTLSHLESRREAERKPRVAAARAKSDKKTAAAP